MNGKSLLLILILILATTSAGVATRYHLQLSSQKAERAELEEQLARVTEELRHARKPAPAPAPAPAVPIFPDPPPATEPDLRSYEIDALRAELEDRERLLQTLRAQLAASSEPRQPREPRPSWEDQLQSIRENDPERYAEIIARREEARREVNDAFARKAAHFLNRDTSLMTDQDAEDYNLMLELLHETWVLADRMREVSSIDEGRELRRELMERTSLLRPLLREQRDREFNDLARQLGYDDQGAREFVAYINEMLDITSLRPPGWGGRGGRGGQGWGGER
ncbi:MAG TPA: hypothetical protein PKE55_14345 [Kiritimatiellia bacterium]|nr:hypothetical protein [Kiritimatiellia bacterium]